MDLYCKGLIVIVSRDTTFKPGDFSWEPWIDARLSEGYDVTSSVDAQGWTHCKAVRK